jgi:hypothetical protein
MSEHKSIKSAPSPWRVPVATEDIAEGGQQFALAADAEVRAGIAQMVGLRDLPRLEADFDVSRQGADGLRVIGRVSATVGQNCVVTLEPLANEIEETVDLIFMPSAAADPAPAESDEDDGVRDGKWDDPEPLIGGQIDLGALATEFLILGLDPYPRKPGAVFEPPRDFQPEESPFAALAGRTKGRDGT